MHREGECIYTASRRGRHNLKSKEASPPLTNALSAVPLDAMGVIDEVNNADSFLGPSAALSFFDLVRQAILAYDPEPKQPTKRATEKPEVQLMAPMSEEEMRVLPERAEADRLLAYFLDVGQGTYPILHEPTFKRAYERAFTAPASPPFLALLNITFAVGSLFSTSATGTTAEAEAYAARCLRILAAFSPLNNGSLLVVQTLVFLALFSQSKASPTQCWNSLGLATRMALALGLHVEPPARAFDAITAEQRRRAWWACFSFDTIMSCMFGRPAMVTSVDATAARPSPFPDEALNPLPRFALFSATTELYEVLGQVVTQANTPTGDAEQLKAMLDLEAVLETWQEGLPERLCSDAPPNPAEPSWVTRHRTILHSRYLHTRILLFRPSLARALSQTPSKRTLQLGDSTWHAAAAICLETAQRQIDICHRSPARTLAGNSRWYEIAYLFGACAVLLASRWRGAGLDTFDHSWSLATSILRESRPAAAQALEALRAKLIDGTFRFTFTCPPPSESTSAIAPIDPAPFNAELGALLGEGWEWPSETFDAMSMNFGLPSQPLW